eukprot:COSAG02_NODE_961_length_15629_cov_2.747650_11_plen_61_part_00
MGSECGAVDACLHESRPFSVREMDPDSVDKVGAANLTQFVMQHSGDKELAMMMSAVPHAR